MGELIEHFEDPAISEKILSSVRSFEGRLVKVDSVDIELPNGHKTQHEVIRHPGAVCVIALDDQGRVLIVRQYRTALERVTIEVPAGKIDPARIPRTPCAASSPRRRATQQGKSAVWHPSPWPWVIATRLSICTWQPI